MDQSLSLPSFNIPKIKRQTSKGHLRNVNIASRDAKEVLQSITRSYLDHTYKGSWQVTATQLVENKDLEETYRTKRALMKDEGRQARDLTEQYAFLLVRDSNLIPKIAKSGLKTHYFPYNDLGDSKYGIYVCRHADVQFRLADGWQLDTFNLIVFKSTLGRCKALNTQTSELTGSSIEPTPNFDCHVHQYPAHSSNSDKLQLVRSQVYMYEYNEDSEPSDRPRHCLPMAVIQYQKTYGPGDDSSYTQKPPNSYSALKGSTENTSPEYSRDSRGRGAERSRRSTSKDQDPRIQSASQRKDPRLHSSRSSDRSYSSSQKKDSRSSSHSSKSSRRQSNADQGVPITDDWAYNETDPDIMYQQDWSENQNSSYFGQPGVSAEIWTNQMEQSASNQAAWSDPIQQQIQQSAVGQAVWSDSMQQQMQQSVTGQAVWSDSMQQQMQQSVTGQAVWSDSMQQQMQQSVTGQAVWSDSMQQQMQQSVTGQAVWSDSMQQQMQQSVAGQAVWSDPIQQQIQQSAVNQAVWSDSIQQQRQQSVADQTVWSDPVQQQNIASWTIDKSSTTQPNKDSSQKSKRARDPRLRVKNSDAVPVLETDSPSPSGNETTAISGSDKSNQEKHSNEQTYLQSYNPTFGPVEAPQVDMYSSNTLKPEDTLKQTNIYYQDQNVQDGLQYSNRNERVQDQNIQMTQIVGQMLHGNIHYSDQNSPGQDKLNMDNNNWPVPSLKQTSMYEDSPQFSPVSDSDMANETVEDVPIFLNKEEIKGSRKSNLYTTEKTGLYPHTAASKLTSDTIKSAKSKKKTKTQISLEAYKARRVKVEEPKTEVASPQYKETSQTVTLDQTEPDKAVEMFKQISIKLEPVQDQEASVKTGMAELKTEISHRPVENEQEVKDDSMFSTQEANIFNSKIETDNTKSLSLPGMDTVHEGPKTKSSLKTTEKDFQRNDTNSSGDILLGSSRNIPDTSKDVSVIGNVPIASKSLPVSSTFGIEQTTSSEDKVNSDAPDLQKLMNSVSLNLPDLKNILEKCKQVSVPSITPGLDVQEEKLHKATGDYSDDSRTKQTNSEEWYRDWNSPKSQPKQRQQQWYEQSTLSSGTDWTQDTSQHTGNSDWKKSASQHDQNNDWKSRDRGNDWQSDWKQPTSQHDRDNDWKSNSSQQQPTLQSNRDSDWKLQNGNNDWKPNSLQHASNSDLRQPTSKHEHDRNDDWKSDTLQHANSSDWKQPASQRERDYDSKMHKSHYDGDDDLQPYSSHRDKDGDWHAHEAGPQDDKWPHEVQHSGYGSWKASADDNSNDSWSGYDRPREDMGLDQQRSEFSVNTPGLRNILDKFKQFIPTGGSSSDQVSAATQSAFSINTPDVQNILEKCKQMTQGQDGQEFLSRYQQMGGGGTSNQYDMYSQAALYGMQGFPPSNQPGFSNYPYDPVSIYGDVDYRQTQLMGTSQYAADVDYRQSGHPHSCSQGDQSHHLQDGEAEMRKERRRKNRKSRWGAPILTPADMVQSKPVFSTDMIHNPILHVLNQTRVYMEMQKAVEAQEQARKKREQTRLFSKRRRDSGHRGSGKYQHNQHQELALCESDSDLSNISCEGSYVSDLDNLDDYMPVEPIKTVQPSTDGTENDKVNSETSGNLAEVSVKESAVYTVSGKSKQVKKSKINKDMIGYKKRRKKRGKKSVSSSISDKADEAISDNELSISGSEAPDYQEQENEDVDPNMEWVTQPIQPYGLQTWQDAMNDPRFQPIIELPNYNEQIDSIRQGLKTIPDEEDDDETYQPQLASDTEETDAGKTVTSHMSAKKKYIIVKKEKEDGTFVITAKTVDDEEQEMAQLKANEQYFNSEVAESPSPCRAVKREADMEEVPALPAKIVKSEMEGHLDIESIRKMAQERKEQKKNRLRQEESNKFAISMKSDGDNEKLVKSEQEMKHAISMKKFDIFNAESYCQPLSEELTENIAFSTDQVGQQNKSDMLGNDPNCELSEKDVKYEKSQLKLESVETDLICDDVSRPLKPLFTEKDFTKAKIVLKLKSKKPLIQLPKKIEFKAKTECSVPSAGTQISVIGSSKWIGGKSGTGGATSQPKQISSLVTKKADQSASGFGRIQALVSSAPHLREQVGKQEKSVAPIQSMSGLPGSAQTAATSISTTTLQGMDASLPHSPMTSFMTINVPKTTVTTVHLQQPPVQNVTQHLPSVPQQGHPTAQIPLPQQSHSNVSQQGHAAAHVPLSQQSCPSVPQQGHLTAQIPLPHQGHTNLSQQGHLTAQIPLPHQGHANVPQQGHPTAQIPLPQQGHNAAPILLPQQGQPTVPQQGHPTAQMPLPQQSHTSSHTLPQNQITIHLPTPNRQVPSQPHASTSFPPHSIVSVPTHLQPLAASSIRHPSPSVPNVQIPPPTSVHGPCPAVPTMQQVPSVPNIRVPPPSLPNVRLPPPTSSVRLPPSTSSNVQMPPHTVPNVNVAPPHLGVRSQQSNVNMIQAVPSVSGHQGKPLAVHTQQNISGIRQSDPTAIPPSSVPQPVQPPHQTMARNHPPPPGMAINQVPPPGMVINQPPLGMVRSQLPPMITRNLPHMNVSHTNTRSTIDHQVHMPSNPPSQVIYRHQHGIGTGMPIQASYNTNSNLRQIPTVDSSHSSRLRQKDSSHVMDWFADKFAPKKPSDPGGESSRQPAAAAPDLWKIAFDSRYASGISGEPSSATHADHFLGDSCQHHPRAGAANRESEIKLSSSLEKCSVQKAKNGDNNADSTSNMLSNFESSVEEKTQIVQSVAKMNTRSKSRSRSLSKSVFQTGLRSRSDTPSTTKSRSRSRSKRRKSSGICKSATVTEENSDLGLKSMAREHSNSKNISRSDYRRKSRSRSRSKSCYSDKSRSRSQSYRKRSSSRSHYRSRSKSYSKKSRSRSRSHHRKKTKLHSKNARSRTRSGSYCRNKSKSYRKKSRSRSLSKSRSLIHQKKKGRSRSRSIDRRKVTSSTKMSCKRHSRSRSRSDRRRVSRSRSRSKDKNDSKLHKRHEHHSSPAPESKDTVKSHSISEIESRNRTVKKTVSQSRNASSLIQSEKTLSDLEEGEVLDSNDSECMSQSGNTESGSKLNKQIQETSKNKEIPMSSTADNHWEDRQNQVPKLHNEMEQKDIWKADRIKSVGNAWSQMLKKTEKNTESFYIEHQRSYKKPKPVIAQDEESSESESDDDSRKESDEELMPSFIFRIETKSIKQTLADWLRKELKRDEVNSLQKFILYPLSLDLTALAKSQRRKIKRKVRKELEAQFFTFRRSRSPSEEKEMSKDEIQQELAIVRQHLEKVRGSLGIVSEKVKANLDNVNVSNVVENNGMQWITSSVSVSKSFADATNLTVTKDYQLRVALQEVESDMLMCAKNIASHGKPHCKVPEEIILNDEQDSYFTKDGVFLILLHAISDKPYRRLCDMRKALEQIKMEMYEATKRHDRKALKVLRDQRNTICVQRRTLLLSFTGSLTRKRLKKLGATKEHYALCYNHLKEPLEDELGIKLGFIKTMLENIKSHYAIVQKEVV